MAMISAGLLVRREGGAGPEFLLGKMGGPYWAKKDAGAWTIPKGLIEPGEDPAAAAVREFAEETGLIPPEPLLELTPVRQAGGKLVRCWLARGDLPIEGFASNLFEMEWPPRSGRRASFPELERLGWFDAEGAAAHIVAGQRPLILEAASACDLKNP